MADLGFGQEQGRSRSGLRGIPDMKFINREIPIVKIARALDLRLDGDRKIHCWHPELHKNGDRSASVGIRITNNTVKCFGCDSRPMGTIDLVMDVLGMKSPADAAGWVAAKFDVPTIARQRRRGDSPRMRVGHEQGLALIIRSGLWGWLSEATQAIAPVIWHFAEKEEPHHEVFKAQISYQTIMRYSGLTSPNAVHKGLVELSEIDFLTLPVRGRREALERGTNTYVVKPYSDILWELAQTAACHIRQEIEAEVELRARLRRERIRLLRAKPKNNSESD
jgi:hypothetical protein